MGTDPDLIADVDTGINLNVEEGNTEVENALDLDALSEDESDIDRQLEELGNDEVTGEHLIDEDLLSDEEDEDLDDESDLEEDDEEESGLNGIKSKITDALAPLLKRFSKKSKEDEDDEDFDDEEDDSEEDSEEEEHGATRTSLTTKMMELSLLKKLKKTPKGETEEDDLEDEEEDDLGEVDEASNKFEAFIHSQLPFLSKFIKKKKKTTSDSDDSDEDDDDESASKDTKKKIGLKPIHLIVIGILGVFLFVDFDESEKKEPTESTKKKKVVTPAYKKDLKKKKKTVKKEIAPIVEKSPPQVASEPEVEKTDEIDPPTNNLEDSMAGESNSEPMSAVGEDLSDELKPIDETNNVVDNNDSLEVEPVMDTSTPSALSDEPELSNGGSAQSPTEKSIDEDILNSDVSDAITNEILKGIEKKAKKVKEKKLLDVRKPTDAPSYDSLGENLVYNCKDKHWACVNSSAYAQCRENYSWNKKQKIKLDCYPDKILDNESDCASLQQQNIDEIEDTDFCN